MPSIVYQYLSNKELLFLRLVLPKRPCFSGDISKLRDSEFRDACSAELHLDWRVPVNFALAILFFNSIWLLPSNILNTHFPIMYFKVYEIQHEPARNMSKIGYSLKLLSLLNTKFTSLLSPLMIVGIT